MYQVILSINNNEEVAVLPAVPTDLGPSSPEQRDYEGLSGDYNTLGPMGLWEMSIASFFPVGRRYSFMPADAWTDGWKYVDFFERNRPRMLPFRDHHSGRERRLPHEQPCSVDQFEWHVKRNGDISYSLTLREYRFVSGAK